MINGHQATSPPRVFVSQIPSKLSKPTNTWIPQVDISPVSDFGESIIMLPPNAAWMPANQVCGLINQELSKHSFNHTDHLLLLGAPFIMAAVAVAAKRIVGPAPLKILVWDRHTTRYILQEIV